MLLLQTVLARIEQDIQKEVTKNLLKKHRETRGISQSIYTVSDIKKNFWGTPLLMISTAAGVTAPT